MYFLKEAELCDPVLKAGNIEQFLQTWIFKAIGISCIRYGPESAFLLTSRGVEAGP